MGMSTTYLAGLLAMGFIMLMIGWPWWLGIGLIVLTMAVALSGEEAPARIPGVRGIAATYRPATLLAKAAAKGGGIDVYDMKWSPSIVGDGVAGINPMKGEEGGSVGARTMAYTQDMGPIRFKDDIRFRMDSLEDGLKMCETEAPVGGKPDVLMAWDFRTRKDAMFDLHTGVKTDTESMDYAANPGLGSPNEWIAQMKKDKR
jgi:hypothetical protein